MPIERLAEELTHKIAAGEVIDRPASVVKELVENAIDAGSRAIELDIREGGLQSMVVRDDGHGMDEADLRLCGQRHATSKIRTEDDLLSIRTLGFRGEAIASIAAVSRMRITSRSSAAPDAWTLSVEGGVTVGLIPSSRAPGTTVEVADLFFNLPARAKFLGAPRTESLHINRVVQRFALVLPGVGFVLTHDGREVFAAPRVTSLLDRISQVYGVDVARGMIPIEGRRGDIRI
ncbi:MAG: DNA mismatch repair endonuclease MutL, partial [Candidatus Bipolaricaulis sp.]|nr:DNA mismatch repair endonuclease MutL [Candidatus Bipolaricaulis sp.]